MPATKASPKKAASKKGAAARAEKKNEEKVVDFRGYKIKLPTKIPGTLLFDFADLQSGNELRGTMELIKSLVGAESYQVIRDKIGSEGLDFEQTEEALVGLLHTLFETYGTSLGE